MFIDILPVWYQYAFVGVFGLIIGSFLNVYIYRFHTGKSLSGHSHCLSCGVQLRSYELVPLFSYVVLKGKCRTCGCYIPVRYFIVELLTALLFLLSYCIATDVFELLFLLVAMSILVVITVYDIRHYIIPDSLTAALTLITLLWYGVLLFQGMEWMTAAESILAALAGTGFFFLLWFVSKGAWLGFGDVKLAFPLGLIASSTLVFSMIVYSFWVGAAISLLLIGISKLARGQVRLGMWPRRLTIKSVVPFAPFMIAGCLIVLFTRFNVLSLFSSF
jgi:prepilin signal peptidase PulO-like enzyme (type II secretory pathway)